MGRKGDSTGDDRVGRECKMKDKDYPGLFSCADKVSVDAQKVCLCLERGRLGLLILGSFAPIMYALWDKEANEVLDGLVVVVLVLVLVVGLLAKVRRDDRVWFDGRAVAESAKAATWRYMMSMTPYNDGSSRARFVGGLKEIRCARESVATALARQRDASGGPSEFMETVRREWAFEDRRKFYIAARLEDQRDWYGGRARKNGEWEEYTFWWFVGLQVVAVVAAVAKLVFGWPVSIVPVLMTVAAALIAWGETKRYRELARSYAVARDELEDQRATAKTITGEVAFVEFIETVEETISREHAMWCVKREPAAASTAK